MTSRVIPRAVEGTRILPSSRAQSRDPHLPSCIVNEKGVRVRDSDPLNHPLNREARQPPVTTSATRNSRDCASHSMRYASGRKPPAGYDGDVAMGITWLRTAGSD